MFFNIKIDTEKMSLEELKKARNEAQNVLVSLNHYIRTCEKAKRISRKND